MRNHFILLILLLGVAELSAQLPYESKKYTYSRISDIQYGSDTAFDGTETSLKLDLYKPVGDSNCRRPILVMIHGGAWLGGDKAGDAIPAICAEFAGRGYVVASINYRMGMHPTSYYVPYALCVQEKCSYVADSAEWYRALYRAMQDAKSAIRFMKNRNATDSTDPENVFLCGESAGAFTAMHTAWVDQNSEKPAQCDSLADAPTPDTDLKSCVVTNATRKRPDLGSIDGKGNTGGYNSRVKGVAAFYGGVLDTSIFRQSNTADTPVLYNFHQTCDVVVDANKGRLFWKVYYYCYAPVNLCMPYSVAPMSWGSTAIKTHIDSMKGLKPRNMYRLNSTGGAYSCDPKANCHGVDNIPNRCAEIATFFSPVISASGNNPAINPCTSGTFYPKFSPEFTAYPNPASGIINLRFAATGLNNSATCILEGMDGKLLFSSQVKIESGHCSIRYPENLRPGVYTIRIAAGKHSAVKLIALE